MAKTTLYALIAVIGVFTGVGVLKYSPLSDAAWNPFRSLQARYYEALAQGDARFVERSIPMDFDLGAQFQHTRTWGNWVQPAFAFGTSAGNVAILRHLSKVSKGDFQRFEHKSSPLIPGLISKMRKSKDAGQRKILADMAIVAIESGANIGIYKTGRGTIAGSVLRAMRDAKSPDLAKQLYRVASAFPKAGFDPRSLPDFDQAELELLVLDLQKTPMRAYYNILTLASFSAMHVNRLKKRN